jgi:hypothetical protein
MQNKIDTSENVFPSNDELSNFVSANNIQPSLHSWIDKPQSVQ